MGITARYVRMPPEQFQQLIQKNDSLMDIFFPKPRRDKKPETHYEIFDLDKNWQELHFLLTGQIAYPDIRGNATPLNNAILGGHWTTIDAGYDKVRYLLPEEVQAVVSVFDQFTPDWLRTRYKNQFKLAVHAPRFQNWSDDTLAFYLDLFSELKLFFERASQAGNIVGMGLF